MARPQKQGIKTVARSLRERRRFCRLINPDKVFGTHNREFKRKKFGSITGLSFRTDSGPGGKGGKDGKVKNRKHTIAIGLSKPRKKRKNVPAQETRRKFVNPQSLYPPR
jgi:Family of unknown function (DUF6496)